MSRNIRPGAFPPRPNRSRQNDDYGYASESAVVTGGYGKPGGRNEYSRRGGDDDAYYSQSQSSYEAGRNRGRDDGGYQDRGGYSRSNNTRSTDSTASTNSSSGSSLLSRMKVRSTDTSTRTSIDDDSERTPPRGGGWARKPPAVQENRQREEELGTAICLESPAANALTHHLSRRTNNIPRP